MLLAREASLGRPSGQNDLERQLAIGTYDMAEDDAPFKLLLDGLPCERIMALEDQDGSPNESHRLAFHLPGSSVVLLLELLVS